MVHETHSEAAGPHVKLTCRECRQASAGRVLHRERRPYYFGIPLGVERQVLVRCGNCGTEYFAPSLPLNTQDQCDVDPYLGKVNSPLFPKILIVLMLISTPLLFVPFMIHFFLWTDRSYKSRRWQQVHKVAFWLAVVVNLILWLPMFAKDLISKKP